MTAKECRRCKTEKELSTDNFPRNKRQKDGFDSMCKGCWSARGKERRQTAGAKVIQRAKNTKGWEESGGVPAKKRKAPAIELAPQGLDVHKLESYRELPAGVVKLFDEETGKFEEVAEGTVELWETQGSLQECVNAYYKKFGVMPTTVHAHARYFFEVPKDILTK